VPAALLGSVGGDATGTRAREELAAAGVETGHVRTVAAEPTTVKYLLVDDAGEVAVLANEGANEAFRAEDLPESALDDADHLHLTSQRPGTATTLAERARDAGLDVSIDPGRRIAARNFADAVAAADLCFLNDLEATAAERADLFEAAPGDLTVVETMGPGGASLRDDGRTITHPGFATDSVDTTGAGDAFAAGFIAARLEGVDAERQLAVGNACGALAAAGVGARPTLSWESVEQVIADGTAPTSR
jgi:ribokinase